MSTMKHNLPGHHSRHQRVPPQHAPDYEYSECDSQSWVMSDRPSVAGQSSHSGSHSGVMVNKKAKELRDIVHHQLRSDLKECRCDSCLQVKYREQYQRASSSTHSMGRHEYDNNSRNAYHYPHSSHSNSYHHSNETVQDMNRYNTISSHRGSRSSHHREAYEQQDIVPPPDNNKIYSWLEKNERYQQEGFTANPAPSPSIRRKGKKPVTYNTSRNVGQAKNPLANDTGMPILPPPDAENVLQEVKRVLEEPQQQSRSSRQQSSQHQQYHNHHHHQYDNYDKRSMVSAPWSMSDNSSIVSYNPSQISTVPSSASRLWNAQGYFDNGHEEQRHTPSEVRSQATSRHSGGRSIPHRSDYHHSDVRSQSTGVSQGSDGSRGRSKNRTVITYYFGSEPIPYRISLSVTEVTLGQFKSETKRGNYRFYFKTVSSVDNEVVWEEFKDDDAVLPRYNEQIVGKVDKL